MMARAASLENLLELHRLNCVDRPSSFGDISVASLENMLRSSAAGKFAFFAYVPVISSPPLALEMSWRQPSAVTRDAAKVRCSSCRRLARVGCSRNVMLAKRSVERPLCFFFFFIYFLFWWTCFDRSSCLACEGFPEETILWYQVSREGSWALRSQSLPVCSVCTFPASLRHGDYRSREDSWQAQITDRRRNRWFGVNVPHAPRPAEWCAILFLWLPTLTRPGLDLGLSRTGKREEKERREREEEEKRERRENGESGTRTYAGSA